MGAVFDRLMPRVISAFFRRLATDVEAISSHGCRPSLGGKLLNDGFRAICGSVRLRSSSTFRAQHTSFRALHFHRRTANNPSFVTIVHRRWRGRRVLRLAVPSFWHQKLRLVFDEELDHALRVFVACRVQLVLWMAQNALFWKLFGTSSELHGPKGYSYRRKYHSQ